MTQRLRGKAWLAAVTVWFTGAIAMAQPARPDAPPPAEEPFVQVTAKVRPSVVAVGIYNANDTLTVIYAGTGFVVDDGLTVATNQHVVEAIRKKDRLGHIRVFFPDDKHVSGRTARLMAEDRLHDIAILKNAGPKAPALDLAPHTQGHPPQGRSIGIMGYPVGLVLGLVPAVHKGVVAAVVPSVLPLPKGAKLKPELVEAIQNPYHLYQLDIVAFPGNSGSPLFDARTGQVVGIVNKVLGSRTREHLISHPSGITYAVPAHWVQELVIRASISAENKPEHDPKRTFR